MFLAGFFSFMLLAIDNAVSTLSISQWMNDGLLVKIKTLRYLKERLLISCFSSVFFNLIM